MADKVFDNLGNGSGTWEDPTDWDPEGVPADGDTIRISADCTVSTDYSALTFSDLEIDAGKTLTVANGGDIRFGTNPGHIAATGKLHIDTGGNIRYTDTYLEVDGIIEFDGGVFELYSTATTSTYIYMQYDSAITATANGGTVRMNCAADAKCYIRARTGGVTIAGNPAARLILDCGNGVAKANGIQGYESYSAPAQLSHLEIRDAYIGVKLGRTNCATITDCLIHGCQYCGLFCDGGPACLVRDCVIYDCYVGMYGHFASCLSAVNIVLGETEDETPAPNDYDVSVKYMGNTMVFYNCKFSSPVPVRIETTYNQWSGRHCGMISNAHDQDKEAFKRWIGPGHTLESEFSITHGGSRQSLKMTTSSKAGADERRRADFTLATWPATHGDTLDVSLYVRGQAGDKIKLIVDPEGHYGTTQSTEHTQSVSDAWEKVSVPTYTVNTNPGEKMGIPIVVRCEEPLKTWYLDTLEVN